MAATDRERKIANMCHKVRTEKPWYSIRQASEEVAGHLGLSEITVEKIYYKLTTPKERSLGRARMSVPDRIMIVKEWWKRRREHKTERRMDSVRYIANMLPHLSEQVVMSYLMFCDLYYDGVNPEPYPDPEFVIGRKYTMDGEVHCRCGRKDGKNWLFRRTGPYQTPFSMNAVQARDHEWR